jgi:hypothetical protein
MRSPRRRDRARGQSDFVSRMACALFALLAYTSGLAFSCPAQAATAGQDTLINVLFGSLPDPGGLDANQDGFLSAADLLLLPPDPTPTSSATRTSTRTPSATPSPTETAVPSSTPTPTSSPTPSLTATETSTPTPVGLLFDGTISDLVPHALGDRLVYRVTDPMGRVSTETTLVVTETGGAFVVDDLETVEQQPRKHERQSYTDTGSQLFFSGGTDLLRDLRTTCNPPLLRLTMPLIAGETFSTTVRCTVRIASRDIFVGFIDRIDTFTPIELLDSLTVIAGTYASVVHIHGTTNLSGDLESNEIYLAPGVGAILQLSTAGGQTTRRELIDGTIGGVPVAR